MTELAIVESRADRASVHVCEALRDLADWTDREDDGRPDADGGGRYWRTDGAELRSFDDLHLHLERPADAFDGDPDLLVFASRHSGETGPLLTGHFTGNFGPAEYGGDDRALATAAPTALGRLLAAFDEHAPEGYDVGLECTHHGPTDVGAPSLFAELGSAQAQWDDREGAAAVARAVLALRDADPRRERTIVGFGGGHYVPRFERIVRETPWAVGHVGSDWALEAMGAPDADRNRAVLAAAFEASGADLAVVEGERPALEAAVDELGYRVASETWLREVGDRPLALVEAVEAALGPIDGGVRFGDVTDAADVRVVDLPEGLIGAAEGIDPDRARAAVASRVVAVETTNGGSRLGARAAVPAADASEREPDPLAAVVEALAAILEDSYERVRLEDGAVVAEGTAFDPELAREAGVPEGPKFGALADGEAVAVDGETVRPADVYVDRIRRFAIPDGAVEPRGGDR